ncbi:piggyBac transposable element-derived protein 1-like [Vespa mandarinia]|uniref:piggyBac transposable element-derived protein 1-like n=1 Tax=Vespa mandarinia TaxID=7446 RepID=UPI0016208691|nr:piggyBac transposable element-derived protein 1-like [Vespa mandarinia]
MNQKRKSLSINTNPCGHIIVDDDDCIVPVKRKKQLILSTSEDSDSDLSNQCLFNNLPFTKDVSNQRDSQEPSEKFDSLSNFPSQSKLIEFFELFFDSTLWELIVDETNKYAEYSRFSPRELKSFEREIWTPVTVLEMKAFIAVLLEMGITRKPNIRSY